jgi:hypothetical protein
MFFGKAEQHFSSLPNTVGTTTPANSLILVSDDTERYQTGARVTQREREVTISSGGTRRRVLLQEVSPESVERS